MFVPYGSCHTHMLLCKWLFSLTPDSRRAMHVVCMLVPFFANFGNIRQIRATLAKRCLCLAPLILDSLIEQLTEARKTTHVVFRRAVTRETRRKWDRLFASSVARVEPRVLQRVSLEQISRIPCLLPHLLQWCRIPLRNREEAEEKGKR